MSAESADYDILSIIEAIKRLKKVTNDLDVAKILGVKPVTLAAAKRRKSFPFHDQLVKFCNKEGLDINQFYRSKILTSHADIDIQGKGEISGGYAPGEEPEPVSESVIDIEYEDAVGKLIVNPVISYMDTDFVKLGVFKRTGAGNEMVGVEYEQIDTVVIPKKLYGAHLIPFKVYGESMEKLIMENSIVLVDTSPHDDIEEGKIYCFRIPYRGFIIRKVEKSLDGLYLIPYNKTFEERQDS